MEKSEEKRDENLPGDRAWDEPDERRTSKLAILSVVLGISSGLFFALTGIPAILTAVAGIYMIRSSVGTLKGESVALAGIVISILSMFVFFMFWRLDAPPIPDDYTVADLRSAPPQCAESFEILKTLLQENPKLPGSPAMGLTKEDIKIIENVSEVIKHGTTSEITDILTQHATEINHAWTGTEKAREVIRRLNEFPEIADLTEPGIGFKSLPWHNLLRLVRLYQAYGHCRTKQEDIQLFSEYLIELDSVYRKLSLNARPFVGKLICLACIDEDIVTANAIANHPESSPDSLDLIAKHFTPVTKEQVSLRNGILSEYFLLQDTVSQASHQIVGGRTPLLKQNSMLRLYRNLYHDWIAAVEGPQEVVGPRLSVWPDGYPFAEPSISFGDDRPLTLLYQCYNPLAIKTGFFYRASIFNKPTTQIQDDLFQIVLNKRLGREVSLKARDYGDEYIIDIENRRIFSPGPDGKVGTKDDIDLSINPEVLGWSYSTPR